MKLTLVPYLLKHKLGQFRLYWLGKNVASNIIFFTNRVQWIRKRTANEESIKMSGFRQLVFISAKQFCFGILSAILIQYLNALILPLIAPLNLSIPNDDAYSGFLGTVAGIGGVFIGLYYAAISSIGSAIYSNKPSNIRDLLATERVGSSYMTALAYMTFTSLALFAMYLLGFQKTHLAILFTTILVGVGIISFVKLGQRVFYFFDPTQLSRSVFFDLYSHLKNVQPKGFRWLDRSFQNTARRNALVCIDVLNTVNDVARNEVYLQGKPYVDFAIRTCGFLCSYQNALRRIPPSSLWYGQKYIHRDWYKTSETYLHTATITNTQISPEVVPDKSWLEDKLFRNVEQCLSVNYAENRYELTIQLIDMIDLYIQSLSENANIKSAFTILDSIVDIFLKHLPEVDEKAPDAERIERLAIFERLPTLCINILLKYLKYVDCNSREGFDKKLSKINWGSKSDPYMHDFAPHLLVQIEWLHKRLSFENKAEGVVVSPVWYQTELLCLTEAITFNDCVKELVAKCAGRFEKWIECCTKKKRFWINAALQSRELEYWNKIEHHFAKLEQRWNSLVTEKKISGLAWPADYLSEAKATIAKRQKDLLKSISTHSYLLSLMKRPSDFPDYAGQFLHMTAHSVLRSLCDGDEELLKSTYKPFYYASITKFNALRPVANVVDWRYEGQVKNAIAPIIDLIEMSGYGKLMSDFHCKKDLWIVIQETWDEYLAQPDQQKAPLSKVNLTFFSNCISLLDSGLGIPYRAVTRTGWLQQIQYRLSELPKRSPVSVGRPFYSYPKVDHESPLVRYFAKDPISVAYDGIDVFIEEYFLKRDDAKNLVFKSRQNEFAKQMKLEVENYKEDNDE
jgi:hypothetical protein